MKYFEFNIGDFPYYALIAANNVEDAKICYILYVYELHSYDGEPIEITYDELLSTLSMQYSAMENGDNDFEKIKTELEIIKLAKEPYLLLIDDGLFQDI